MKKIILWTFIIIGLFYPGSTEAKNLPGIDLGVMVVTPTGFEESSGNMASTVDVVTRRDIENTGATSATDILGNLPGVHINKTGDFGRADVDIRGLGERGRKIMVLEDGRPVKMGLYGCTISHSLPLDNIERIEVIKGPSSVLYGSDALGGVVNIITRKPQKSGINTKLDLSYGSYDTGIYKIAQKGKVDSFDYGISASKTGSDGFTQNSEYDAENFSGRIGYNFNDNISLSVNGKYFNGLKEEPEPAPEDSRQDYERGFLSTDFSRKGEEFEFKGKIYRNFGEHKFSDGWHSKDFTDGLMIKGITGMGDNNELTGGIEYRRQGGEVVKAGNSYDKYEYAVYLLDEHKLSNKLAISLGGRYNIDEFAGDVFTAQAGAIYRITKNMILRLNRSGGFRSPQINELYLFPPSNKDLEAEKTINYEAGLNRSFGKFLNLDFSVYKILGENMIRDIDGKFKNTGDFEFKGAQVNMKARITDFMDAGLSYSYLDPGKYTTGKPGNKFDGSVNLGWDNISFHIDGQHISSYYAEDNSGGKIDDYFLADVRLTYKLTGNVKTFAGVDNMLNTSYKIYADLPGGSAGLYQMPGRNYNFGLSYEF
ncbi:MAG: TonB-dependent receptor [Elusimicrobiota bacterium]